MDSVQRKSVQSFLTNTQLFYSLVSSYIASGEDDKILDLIKTQASMNKSVMEDLGLHSQDLETIRSLNERIRSMEDELGNSGDLNFKKVCQFLNSKKESLNKFLETNGLYGGLSLSIQGGAVCCEFNVYGMEETKDKHLTTRNEQQLQEMLKQHASLLASYKQNFDVSLETPPFSGRAVYGILYTDKNLETMQQIFVNFFQSSLTDVAVECREHGKSYEISKFKFTVLTLDSYKAFAEAMKN